MRVRFSLPILLLALALAGNALAGSPPANIRPDLDAQWLDSNGNLRWPPNDGAAGAPVPVILSPGMLLDRFGGDGGNFLSPKGAAYAARALPYVCAAMAYKAYRVKAPILAWTAKAAPWFDQPGGATQFQTDASVAQLLRDRAIAALPDPGPAPCGK